MILVEEGVIPFAEYCAKVKEHVERSHGVRVVTRDIPDPLIGDLDGVEIQIDHEVSSEQRLFLLAHLFGHTVQWNTDPQAFEAGRLRQPPISEELLPAIMEYELKAAGYALGMFHQIGITGIDQWLSDYTACDLAYLCHYYRTGEKKDFRSFWRSKTPLIRPEPVPPFAPTKRSFRGDGVVI